MRCGTEDVSLEDSARRGRRSGGERRYAPGWAEASATQQAAARLAAEVEKRGRFISPLI